ncbi:MAG TPA: Gfo/Idh/MocA family oxidoreductase [Gaiellaceae bacterium]|nr:Gfo/Idh/MocA family oxidoreductase [Gaiellaceae bacterium]
MSSRPLRIGLLSTANINRKLLATRRGAGDPYAFVAVGSRDPARAEAYAREWGIERAHGSYEQLLADPEVDAVYVALPNALHAEWTLRALAAGKHVLCEKPLSRRPERVVEAFDAARTAGLVLMEGYMWRHNPLTRLLVERLPEIGRLTAIRATFSFLLAGRENVRLRPEIGGGALLDVGCYCVGGARLLAGREPDRVFGEAVVGESGVDEQCTGILRFGEVTAEFTCGFRGEHRSLEAIGSAGSATISDPWFSSEGVLVVGGREQRIEPVDSYRLELENLAAAVRGEAEPLVTREDSLGQARTLDALLRSAETGESTAL